MNSVADQYAERVADLLRTCDESELLIAIKDEIDDECKFIAIYEEMDVNGRKHEDLIGLRGKPRPSEWGRIARRLVAARCRRKPSLVVNAAFAVVRCTGG